MNILKDVSKTVFENTGKLHIDNGFGAFASYQFFVPNSVIGHILEKYSEIIPAKLFEKLGLPIYLFIIVPVYLLVIVPMYLTAHSGCIGVIFGKKGDVPDIFANRLWRFRMLELC